MDTAPITADTRRYRVKVSTTNGKETRKTAAGKTLTPVSPSAVVTVDLSNTSNATESLSNMSTMLNWHLGSNDEDDEDDDDDDDMVTPPESDESINAINSQLKTTGNSTQTFLAAQPRLQSTTRKRNTTRRTDDVLCTMIIYLIDAAAANVRALALILRYVSAR